MTKYPVNDSQFEALRAQWEGDLYSEAAVFVLNGCVLTVFETTPGAYTIMRYFQISAQWHASCDTTDTPVAEALLLLGNFISDWTRAHG